VDVSHDGIHKDRKSDEIRQRTARSIWAVMVGTLQLSRLVPDKELSTQLLQDGIANALRHASEVKNLT